MCYKDRWFKSVWNLMEFPSFSTFGLPTRSGSWTSGRPSIPPSSWSLRRNWRSTERLATGQHFEQRIPLNVFFSLSSGSGDELDLWNNTKMRFKTSSCHSFCLQLAAQALISGTPSLHPSNQLSSRSWWKLFGSFRRVWKAFVGLHCELTMEPPHVWIFCLI